jgi:23S rRNA maturation mini-RNase III
MQILDRRWTLTVCSVLLGSWGCHHHQAVQPTAYVGDGVYEGSPPLCFQHREETRPGTFHRSLQVQFTNTCDFALDCDVYNDVTETEQRIVVLAKQRSVMYVPAVADVTDFDVELNCSWKQ